MTEPGNLTICAPLRIEQFATTRGLGSHPHVRVVRIGMGPERARAAAAMLPAAGPVAVLGVAGGLVTSLRVPAVVVASSVVTAETAPRACDAPESLVDQLTAAGLEVHRGTVVSVPAIVSGTAAREALATEYDALACDMESAYLAEGVRPDRTLVVIRVLSDSPTEPLLHPGVIPRGYAALRAVRRAATVLGSWRY
jgi:4-hydroxy-3-methylbut-2-enyl diphosphate reductase